MHRTQRSQGGRDIASTHGTAVAQCAILDLSLPLMRRIDATAPPHFLAAEGLHFVWPQRTVLYRMPLGRQLGIQCLQGCCWRRDLSCTHRTATPLVPVADDCLPFMGRIDSTTP